MAMFQCQHELHLLTFPTLLYLESETDNSIPAVRLMTSSTTGETLHALAAWAHIFAECDLDATKYTINAMTSREELYLDCHLAALNVLAPVSACLPSVLVSRSVLGLFFLSFSSWRCVYEAVNWLS